MDTSRGKLVGDIKTVLTDVDDLLRQAAESTGDEARELRRRAEDMLDQAQAKFAAMRDEVVNRGNATVRVTDDWVHDNPWSAIGVGAAVGVLVGMLIARR